MRKVTNVVCPVCGHDTMPILYGLPTSDAFERKDIVLGGCIIEETSPDVACSNCDWSGQMWHVSAPLPPSVWIILDQDEIMDPIGLVAGRFDEISEVFLFGYWHNINGTNQYNEWLARVENPLALTATFGQLSPAVIAEFRVGRERFSSSDLYGMGFQALSKPPKLEMGK